MILEIGSLNGVVVLILGIMLGPPLLLSLIGYSIYKKDPKASKVLFILAAIYLLVGLGFCGTLLI